MPDDDWREQIILLKARMDGFDSSIKRCELDEAKCQALQNKNWEKLDEKLDKINEKITLIKSNELTHVNDRIDALERADKTVITVEQWIKILLAIVGLVGTSMVAFINVLGGKLG